MTELPGAAPSDAVVVALITGLTALGSIAVSIVLPSLPGVAAGLGASAAMARLVVTLFLVVFALSQLAYGPLSDRFGRRAPVLWGLGLFAAGSAACAWAPTIGILLAGRMVQAAGAGAGPALGRAIIRDRTRDADLAAALAVVTAAVALSPMLGPFAGGAIDALFGWHAIFGVLGLAALGLLLAVARWLPETLARRDPASTDPAVLARRYGALLADAEYAAALVCAGMLTAGNFAWNAGAPFVFAMRFHLTSEAYGNLSLLTGAGYVAGTLSVTALARRLGPSRLVYGGIALSLAGAVLLGGLSGWPGRATPAALMATMALYTFGMGIVVPSAASCALSRYPQMAGAAAGLLGTIQIMIGALGTIAAGLVPSRSLAPLAGLIVLVTLAAAASAWIALAPLRQRPGDA